MTLRLKKAKINLVDASFVKDFQCALEEWELTRSCIENPPGEGYACGLCERPALRWMYKIFNHLNGEVLWIGRCCVKRYIRRRSWDEILSEDQILSEVDSMRKSVLSGREMKERLEKEGIFLE
jgi:hypothetical protein